MENIRPIVWVLMGTSFMAIIGVLVMYRMELFGASERFITNTKLFYTVLAVASWVILMTTPDRKDGLKDNEIFQAMQQNCEFVGLKLPEGSSMSKGGIATFNCDGKQADVSLSGKAFKQQLQTMVDTTKLANL